MNIRIVLTVITMVALAGCSTMSAQSDYDPGYDFSKLKTYSWIPNPQLAQSDELFDKNFRGSMDKQLAAKGFSQTDSNPDFKVAYHGDVQSKVDVTNWGYRYPGWYGGVEVYQYEEGTLIVDFVDAASGELIYRSTIKAEIDRRSSDFERRQKRINEAVEKILKDFPPQKK